VRIASTIGGILACLICATSAFAGMLDYTQLLARPRAPAQRIQYGSAPSQFADLYLPSGKGPHRVAVMIHGGCWRADLPGLDLTAYAAEDLRQHGFAVWNVEYRRLGEQGGGYPGTFEDIAVAVDWLRNIAKASKLDLNNVIAVGHSSGGQLALWAAARRKLAKSSPLYRDNPLPIKSAVTLAGINDLEAYRQFGPAICGGPRVIDFLIGKPTRSPWDLYADTSPAQMLPIGVPQFVVSGAIDPIVPAQFGRGYAEKATAAGDKVKEVTFPDAAHFELIDPATVFGKVRAMITQQK
jgi:acetyl esterase/lipase